MNWLDILLIVWLASSAYSGFRLGFLYKVTSLIATIIGLYFATQYTGVVAGWFGAGIWTIIITFLVLISLVSHVAGIAATLVDKAFALAKWIPFVGLANRVAGAVMSLLVSLIILSIVLWLALTFAPDSSMANTVANSILGSIIAKFSLLFLPLVADTLKNLVHA